MAKNIITPEIILVIDTENVFNIPLIVIDKSLNILEMSYATKLDGKSYITRHRTLQEMDKLITKYSVDTLLFEQNKLFIDKIDKYPDPYILRNIMLDFGLKVSIEDKYYDTIKYIMELPQKDWRETVLNKSVKYSIDLYKRHILNKQFDEETLKIINENNYYKSLCLGESILFNNLMNKKYQVNR